MTPTTLPAFHAASLRDSFSRQLSAARTSADLTAAQAAVLQSLCQMPWRPSAQLRVDRPTNLEWTSHEFLDALMISHTDTSISTVYLCLPLRAVEPFADRHSLHIALQDRYGSGAEASVDVEHLATSPFEYWMSNLLTRQQSYVQRLDSSLLNLPSLRGVVSETLQADLAKLSAKADSDPEAWVYHISALTAPKTVERTRRLVDVALDRFCAAPSLDNTYQTLVDPNGTVLSGPRLETYERTISLSLSRINNAMVQSIEGFWVDSGEDEEPNAVHARESLAHLYYLALLHAHHEQRVSSTEIDWLRGLLHAPHLLPSSTLRTQRIVLHSGSRTIINLAGAFVLNDSSSPGQALYLFSARSGLMHFQTHEALLAWLTHADQKTLLEEAIGLSNLVRYQAMARVELRLTTVSHDIFAARVGSVIELQRDNVSTAIAQRGSVPERAAVSIDDAIDVRGFLAPSLLQLTRSSRWLIGKKPLPAAEFATPSVSVSPGSTGYAGVVEMRALSNLISAARPDLGTSLRHMIDLQLALVGAQGMNADNVWIAPQATAIGATPPRQPLLTLAIEQLLADAPSPLADDCIITDAQARPVSCLDANLLNRLLRAIRGPARYAWISQFHRFNAHTTRIGVLQLDAQGQCALMRQLALREELAMLLDKGVDTAWAASWLEQVLNRPWRAMRLPFGEQSIDVHQLSLRIPDSALAIPLSNVMALTLIEVPDGKVVFCSPFDGVSTFDSRAECIAELDRRLRSPQSQEDWLQLVAERYRPQLQTHLQSEPALPLGIEFSPVEGDYAHYLQRSDETRQIFTAEAAFLKARKTGYSPSLFLTYVDTCAARTVLPRQLNELADTLQGAEYSKSLPAWLRDASEDDLQLYRANMERLQASAAMPQHYLFGIVAPMALITEQLWTELAVQFPGLDLDPEQIRVRVAQKYKTGFILSPANEILVTSASGVRLPMLDLSLVEYAMQRAMTAPGIPIEIHRVDGSAPPPGLDADYVREMVKRYDFGAKYLHYLQKKFDVRDRDYAKRRKLFHQQMPANLMDIAIESKIKGIISHDAYRIIESVFEMPDPVARQGQEISDYSIRPLALSAGPSLAADRVAGMYLLGVAPSNAATVVLMSTFNEDFVFREYASEAECLKAIRAPGDLQELVLRRLDPQVSSRYVQGGLTRPRLEPDVDSDPVFVSEPTDTQETTLAGEPVQINTLDYLFEDSLRFVERLGRAEVITNDQVDKIVVEQILKQVFEIGFSFTYGRIALMLAIWQTVDLIQASRRHWSPEQWGTAAAQFSAVLVSLLAHRKPRATRHRPASVPASHNAIAKPVFSWRLGALPMELRSRLRGLQAAAIDLSRLAKDSVPGIYVDPPTGKRYAPVAGGVYEVRKLEGKWTIVNRFREGPALNRTTEGHWALDVTGALRGGGSAWSAERRERAILRDVSDVFITEASGMPEIWARYGSKAAKIRDSRLLAERYLERSVAALLPAAGQLAVPASTQQVLKDFFSVAQPSDALIKQVRNITEQLYRAMLDNSLNTQTSPRYVIGINRPGTGMNSTLAFTDHRDSHIRRIFLTNRFFNMPSTYQRALKAAHASFDVFTHCRATTLIHELAHVVHDAEDIAYVESSAPYLDMLNTSRYQSLYQGIYEAQQQTLTAQTATAELFTTVENAVRRDLDTSDGPARQLILKLSKAKTLAAARTAFLGNDVVRQNIMLANADSIALLITRLSRSMPGSP